MKYLAIASSVENKQQVVSDGDRIYKVTPLFLKSVRNLPLAKFSEDILGIHCYKSKKVYKEVGDKLGVSLKVYKKHFESLAWKVFYTNYNYDIVNKYCYNAYGVSSRKLRNYNSIVKLHNDGLGKFTPLLDIVSATEAGQFKAAFGKGLWKKLNKQSAYRIKLIATVVGRTALAVFDSRRKMFINACLDLSTTVLRHLSKTRPDTRTILAAISFEANNKGRLNNYTEFVSHCEVFRDIMRMSNMDTLPDFLVHKHVPVTYNGRAVNLLDLNVRDLQDLHHNMIIRRTSLRSVEDNIVYPFDESVPRQVEVGGVTFSLIESREALRKEGETMRHCVSSYHSDIMNGSYIVYHAKASNGSRATVGIYIRRICPEDFDGTRRTIVHFELDQCYAKCNTKPSADIRVTLGGLINQLSDNYKRTKRD